MLGRYPRLRRRTGGDQPAGERIVKPFPALLIGAAAGFVCYFMVAKVKSKSAMTIRWTRSVFTERWTLGALTGVFATNPRQRRIEGRGGKVPALGLVDCNAGEGADQAMGFGHFRMGAGDTRGTLVILKIVETHGKGLRPFTKEERYRGLRPIACTMKRVIIFES